MKKLLVLVFIFSAFTASFSQTTLAKDKEPRVVAEQNQNRVNINTASAEQLASNLKGVGLKKAQAIVEYRKAFGDFKSVNELTAVKGIGDKTLEKNFAKLGL